MNILEVSLESIVPYENNPRNNADGVDAVAASIKAFGFKVPVVIDKDNVIVAGHTRVLAAKKLGMKTVPCLIADDLSEQQIKAFRLADNKVGEFATWDEEKLQIELEMIDDLEMMDFGFSETPTVDATDETSDETDPANTNFNYKEQYGVIVMCKSEAEQEEIYNRLVEEGFECKVVAV